MKKKVCLFAILILVVCLLCGCGNVIYRNRDLGPGRFVMVEKYIATSPSADNDYRVIIDRDTNVLYLYYRDGVTPVLNPDGTPQIYEGELK